MTVVEAKVPADLKRIIAAPKTRAKWDDLSPVARRDFISWIESAKQPETRKRRIDSVPSRLASGKRRPCCYAVIPMNLYKAIGELPKAKTQWGALSADEKRDFAEWIGAAKDSVERRQRVEKTCVLLLQGKHHP